MLRKKANYVDLLNLSLSYCLSDPSIYPDDMSLLEQDNYSPAELLSIRHEAPKLALVYVLHTILSSDHLERISRKNKIDLDRAQSQIKLSFGQSVNTLVSTDKDFISKFHEINEDFLSSIDGYNVYIHGSKGKDPFYDGYKHFCSVVFPDRKESDRPVSSITLAKYIRQHIVDKSQKHILKKIKLVW